MRVLNKCAILLPLSGARQRSLTLYKKVLAAVDRVEKSNKRGAMFGLDARIALAIFGALSVISGAALYSAIQNAKVISFYSYIKEIEKAIEQYYLDIGDLPSRSNNLDVRQLVEDNNSLQGWNGPYISSLVKGISSDTYAYLNDISGFFDSSLYISQYLSSGWSSPQDSCSNEDCSIYILLHANNAEEYENIMSYYTLLDDSYDNGDGELSGLIRRNILTTGSNGYLYIKLFPHKLR